MEMFKVNKYSYTMSFESFMYGLDNREEDIISLSLFSWLRHESATSNNIEFIVEDIYNENDINKDELYRCLDILSVKNKAIIFNHNKEKFTMNKKENTDDKQFIFRRNNEPLRSVGKLSFDLGHLPF